MAQTTAISWTDATWNIARGCTKVDEDCKFCYMYRESMNKTRYNPLQVNRTKGVFDFPLKYQERFSKVWHGNPLIFASSLTDFFHPDIDGYRHEAWDIIRRCPHLTFQILTKRPERIAEHLPNDWGAGWHNVWLGTSVGSPAGLQRMIDLTDIAASKLFLSIEPLHQSLNLSDATIKLRKDGTGPDFSVLPAFDWIIAGGESGNETGIYKYRPCELEWIEKIVNDCKRNQIPVFVKQLGTHLAKQLKLKSRHGSDISEWPEHLQIRQFPTIL